MDIREQRGREIYQMSGQITRVDDHAYCVVSQNGNGIYDVLSTELGWFRSDAGKTANPLIPQLQRE